MWWNFLKNTCTHPIIKKIDKKISQHTCDCCHKELFIQEEINSEVVENPNNFYEKYALEEVKI